MNKYNLVISRHKNKVECVQAKVGQSEMLDNKKAKLIGTYYDKEQIFEDYCVQVCISDKIVTVI